MAQTKSRQRQFADLQERPVKDIDPENEHAPPSDSDDSADSDAEKAETKAATDHYVSVGKSKLRAKGTSTASLGPQYRGARVSRADLDAESDNSVEEDEDEFQDAKEELGSAGSSSNGSGDEVFDDPETADLEADHDDRDVEIDSDNAFGESDEERFKDYTFRGSSKVLPGGKGKRVPRATAADFLGSDSEDEEDSEAGEGEEIELGSDEDEEDEEDYSDDGLVDEKRRTLIDDEAEESDEDEEEDGDLDGFIVNSDEDDEEGDEEDEDEDNDDEDEDMEDDEEERKPSRNAATDRSDIAALVAAGSKSVTTSLTEGQQKDIAKGNAIRQQRKAFDALLNVRIRLQKSLVAMNTLPVVTDGFEDQQKQSDEEEEPYEAAEAAALKLWNAIDSFRSNLPGAASAASSKKRKRSDATAETTSQQIWASIEAAEQRAAPRRRAVLQNWSQKANNIRTVDRSSRKFSSAAEKTLVARLDEEMEAPERLVKRTRTPRSCAPAQVARKVNEDANIYDDADFYQLLLKELVDQRTADTSAGGSGSAAATIRFAAVKEAKAKKHVDTKASKGRKMRFNVHDKLQNFMAPEDRRGWEQSAIDRLFGTLFGQKMVLNEDDEGGVSDDDEMDGVDAAEAGLMLFRN